LCAGFDDGVKQRLHLVFLDFAGVALCGKRLAISDTKAAMVRLTGGVGGVISDNTTCLWIKVFGVYGWQGFFSVERMATKGNSLVRLLAHLSAGDSRGPCHLIF
jgi:hypothetical protein